MSEEENKPQEVEVPAEPVVEAPAVEEGKPVGMATIVEDTTPLDNFPAHDENLAG